MILRHPSQAWLLYVFVVFFGIGFGSRAVIFSALTADIFAGRGFGAILVIPPLPSDWEVPWALGWAGRCMIGPAAI